MNDQRPGRTAGAHAQREPRIGLGRRTAQLIGPRGESRAPRWAQADTQIALLAEDVDDQALGLRGRHESRVVVVECPAAHSALVAGTPVDRVSVERTRGWG